MAKAKKYANVEKLPNGTYRWRLNVNGFQDSSKGTTYYDAYQCYLDAQRVKQQMKLGTYVPHGASHSGQDFKSYADNYINSPSGTGKTLAPTTQVKYQSYLGLHLTNFHNAAISAITPAQVRDWHTKLHAKHPTTSARAYSFLAAVLNRAVDDGLIPSNPCKVKGARTASSGVVKYFPTDNDIREIGNHINPRFQILVTFAALTGLRVGELRALRIRSLRKVTVNGQTLYVVDVTNSISNVRGGIVERLPKSASGVRSNQLPAAFSPYLSAYIASIPHGPDNYLFPSENGLKPFDPGVFTNNWKRAKKRAGITVDNFTPHCLRHYAATYYLRNVSNNMADLKAFLGDSSVEAVWKYLHAVQSQIGNVAANIDVSSIVPFALVASSGRIEQ
jgi:integrase